MFLFVESVFREDDGDNSDVTIITTNKAFARAIQDVFSEGILWDDPESVTEEMSELIETGIQSVTIALNES